MEENSGNRLLLVEILMIALLFSLSSTMILQFYLTADITSKLGTAVTKAACEAQSWAERLYAQWDTEAFLEENGFSKDEDGYTLETDEGMDISIIPSTTKTDYGTILSDAISVTMDNKVLIEITQKKYWPEEKRNAKTNVQNYSGCSDIIDDFYCADFNNAGYALLYQR